MTPAQLAVLKAAILADPALAIQPLTNTGSVAVAAALNQNAVPDYTVWKTSVTLREIGEAMSSVEVGGLSTANSNRLNVMQAYSGGVFNPSRADTRAGFDGVFSGVGGTLTRAALLILYKRLANRFEKLFATGAGTDATPATLGLEGNVTSDDVQLARES